MRAEEIQHRLRPVRRPAIVIETAVPVASVAVRIGAALGKALVRRLLILRIKRVAREPDDLIFHWYSELFQPPFHPLGIGTYACKVAGVVHLVCRDLGVCDRDLL